MHALDQAWETLKRDFDLAAKTVSRTARNQVTSDLNRFVRRIRQYQTENEWISGLLDSASGFAEAAAIFEVKNDLLVLRGQSNMSLPADLSFPLASAAAFANAAQTKDPVIALRSASEVGEKLSVAGKNERIYVVPVVNGSRVAAMLFALEGECTDTNGLELVAGIAAAVLERKSNASLHAQIAEAPKAETNSAVLIRELPAWADLSEEQRNLHMRAQRFARVIVAEMQLARPEACRAGREQNNLYLFLKKEIDKARDTYQKQFMVGPYMVDYLHLELVRTAATGDESKLGVEYPGQLV